ncbi:l-2-k09022 [Drosophila busckii]|uniref:HEAT repeat-containing protein 1 n=1 Tax=Drosophila busckii TaxID=30019 RepID=A0A0M3QTC1_DROBS|nr:HEAT repeat-containing protein 1 homolog [Drosophila busckii]ALC38653.1 l-2-k09022 [Drosophila busckii]
MSTSLAQQLHKLAAPQTSVTLADARSRASILFDPKEAATKDRRAIYEIGLSGLLELTAFNASFKEFQLTLFDEATLTLERAVEQSEVNELLNASIAKFMRLLSPYFLLRPAHMCFEWLLRRFQVHEYNRSDVMSLILPYHETNMFVQVLQTMRLRQSDEDWFWLRRLQRPGVPLSKTTIVNRAASVPSFLKFICQSTRSAVKELGPRAHQLQAQLNFYATVVVGALQTAKPLEDWHIATILESLLKGLSSHTVDFAAASYVIVAQLVSRTKLKTKVCNALLERVANCTFERLHTTALLLLIWIHDKQQAAQPQFTPETLHNLVCQKWLIEALAKLAKEQLAIQAICMPLLRGCVVAIRESSSVAHRQFLDSLLSEVAFNKSSAQQFINCFLDTFVETESAAMDTDDKPEDEDTIVIDSDDEEMPGIKTDFQTWYTEFLEKLERRYPEAFDASVKAALSSKHTSSNSQKALKLALGFRLNTTDEKAKRAYEKLYHYNPEWRLQAVQMLLQNLKHPKRRERSYQLLKECVADRLQDESAAVVSALLTLPTADFVEMLGATEFAQVLCELLQRAQQQRQTSWDAVVPQTVQHLTTSSVSDKYDANLLLLALMPYLFPSVELSAREQAALLIILNSNLAEKLPFLAKLQSDEKLNMAQQRQQFMDVLAAVAPAGGQKALLDSVEQAGGVEYLKAAPAKFTHLLLLITAFTKKQLLASDALQLLQRLDIYSKGLEFKLSKDSTQHVPLQLYVDFLLTLSRQTKFGDLANANWSELSAELKLTLKLLQLLGNQVFKEQSVQAERAEWTRVLKEFVNHALPKPQQKLQFLTNFYVYESLDWPDYAVLRLQGFKLLQAQLSSMKDNSFKLSLDQLLHLAHGCSAELQALRQQTLVTLKLLQKQKLEPHVNFLLESLLAHQSELNMDHEQYALILHTILESHEGKTKENMWRSKLRTQLQELLAAPQQPPHCSIALLQALKHLNSAELLTALLPLAQQMLQHVQQSDGKMQQLPKPYSIIYGAIMERFEGAVALKVLQRQPEAWQLLEASFALHAAYIELHAQLQPLPCLLLHSLHATTFDSFSNEHKVRLMQLIVKAASEATSDAIFLAAHKLLKHCSLDCQPLVPLLQQMCVQQATTPANKRRLATQPQLDLSSQAWKQGITLLELLEHKQHLQQTALLIPTLFQLLQNCLSLEEHSTVEYPKQLILSSLLHCCQLSQAQGVQLAKLLPESSFRIEQVVQCLRHTQNPQTQQHALLFLSHCATLYPQAVLHKIVEIFTFVGTTVARHDDAFSLHIIKQVVETIIPTLLLTQDHALLLPVLKVFADICLDVPVHRRLTLYQTLFRVLPAAAHHWQLLCMLLEAQMLQEQAQQGKQILQDKTRLEFACELTLSFEPAVILQTCVQLLSYLTELPASKAAFEQAQGSGNKQQQQQQQLLFDLRSRSFKQLRHFKYLILDFLSGLSCSQQFQAQLSNKELLKPLYQQFILHTLAYVAVLNQALHSSSGQPSLEKYWRVLLNHIHDVLDNAIGLLSPEYFLQVIVELLQHELLPVRLKLLQLLHTKLAATSSYFTNTDATHFALLFAPLGGFIDEILAAAATHTPQQAQLQQCALQALQLLAHRHGRSYLSECRELLAKLTRILKHRAQVPKAVLGNVVLTLVEICASIKAHALASLPKFAPQLTQLLKEQVQPGQAPDYVCCTLVAAIHKLFQTLPAFLGPYLLDIINALTRLSVQLDQSQLAQDKRALSLKQRLNEVWSALIEGVELRILVPSCAKAYESLLESQCYAELGILMRQLLAPCIKRYQNAQLLPVQEPLSELFLQSLQLRLQLKDKQLERQLLTDMEAAASEAFVAWILKLSESSFRPLHGKLHAWAMEQSQLEPQLSYFLLTQRMAEALKSLFVLFSGELLADAARLLSEHHMSELPDDATELANSVDLLQAILATLQHIFMHCSGDYINEHRFNTLLLPLVNQLENALVLHDEHAALQQTLTNCIAQLAAASNDVMWKQLNQQVLLKTRNSAPQVRILAFNSSVAIARKLGESFTPLLPETMPFIAELLEDEHERVERNTRSAVQELETILGEPVQKYL